jgi:predicted acylesterase/phospholipase RssA
VEFLNRFSRRIRQLGDWLRRLDLTSNRTAGGHMQRLGISRHTVTAALLPALLTFLVINGPALRPSTRFLVALASILPGFALFAGALRLSERRRWPVWLDLFIQLATLGVVCGSVWLLAGRDAHERGTSVLYQHVLIPLVGVIAISLAGVACLTAFLFRTKRARTETAGRLKRVELFVVDPPAPPLTWSMFGVALGAAVVSGALRLLLFPSLGALLLPADWVFVGFGTLLAITWVVVAFANVDPSFDASWTLLQRLFFHGWAAIASYAMIALAVARLAHFQYVSTVLDGARSWTIGGYIFATYVLAWWWDYWCATLTVIRLLALLSGQQAVTDAQIEYAVDAAVAGPNLPVQHRLIQSHGSGRLLVLCEEGSTCVYTAYEPASLIDALKNGLSSSDRLRTSLDWVKWRLRTHLLMVSAIVIAVLAGGVWVVHGLEQTPHIATTSAPAPPLLSVADTVFPPEACTSSMPILALAASGGGTRAAVYTASILERLQHAGRLQDVRIVSGVSGGGAALAYFAAHRDNLLTGDKGGWEAFFKSMTDPYIEDVIDGAGEWRVAAGDRLGRLLTESFDRSWGTAGTTIRDVRGVGLILNSALAGRFVRHNDDRPDQSLASIERLDSTRGVSDVAGGRLIFTNLDVPNHLGTQALFDGERNDTHDSRLPIFVINQPGVPLAAAAAANANFPPIFPNVPIDLGGATRFWATDGGAIDNRGTETMLMAVRYALQHETDRACKTLPPLHILEVEASAFSDGYEQDRGIGSLMSAGAAFASQLDAELLADIRARYEARHVTASSLVRFHYLPMPEFLRRAGSFGTHWMMQPKVVVCQDPACSHTQTLTAAEVLSTLRTPPQEPSWTRMVQCFTNPRECGA